MVIGITAGSLDHWGIVPLLKAAGGGAPVTVVAPGPRPVIRQRFLEAGIDLIDLRSALMSDDGAVDRLHLAAPETTNPSEADLVVRAGAATIEWRGTTIRFFHHQFPVFQRLLEGTRSRSRVASGPVIEAATGREAKDLIRDLRQRVEAAGFSRDDAKQLVKAVHGRGYALGLAPERIVVLG